jgi:hypothetical protein
VVGTAALDARILLPDGGIEDDELVSELERRLLQRKLERKQRDLLIEQISSESRALSKQDDQRQRHKLRAAIHLLMATPEFALA